MKRVKAVKADLAQVLEPSSQEPMFTRQMIFLYGVLALAILQILQTDRYSFTRNYGVSR
jgi:hypothetical protein